MAREAEDNRWFVRVGEQAYGPYRTDQMLAFIDEGRVKATSKISNKKQGPFKEAGNTGAFRLAFGLAGDDVVEGERVVGDGPECNFVIISELVSDAALIFEPELSRLGMHTRIAGSSWLLRSNLSVSQIRNTLSQRLKRDDKFVVVDATRDRIAWFNLGPDVDIRLRQVWKSARPEDG